MEKIVAPHRGVWIETLSLHLAIVQELSRPIGACGLKHRWSQGECVSVESRPIGACGLKQMVKVVLYRYHFQSRPIGACGLKRESMLLFCVCIVAPHRGVWIETPLLLSLHLRLMSRPIGACGLKHV